MWPGFFWYAVDTNLFRLGSLNPEKKILGPWMLFGEGRNPHQKKNFFKFLFLSVQIYMKDTECAESKDKSNFRFFKF